METKSILRSVRLRPSVFAAVDQYRGGSFNDKLDNLVMDYLGCRELLVQDWELLQACIADKRIELRRITERVRLAGEADARLWPLLEPVLKLLDACMM